jgi:hypothetical protein
VNSLPVFLAWGQWVAKCPRPDCHNAERIGRCDDGSPGGLTGSSFTCRTSHGGCGLQCAVDWPDNVDDIEYVIRPRPVTARNWSPGETVQDLLRENIEHGLIPTNELDILNGRVTVLREIVMPEPRMQIGVS